MTYRLFPLGDGIGVVFRDMTDRRSAEAQRDLLIKELEHRVKNTLAIVQSIAAQTFRGGVDPAVHRAFEARLITLSNVHGILTQRSWDSADLHEVMASTLRPHDAPDAALHRRGAGAAARAEERRRPVDGGARALHQCDQVRRALGRERPCGHQLGRRRWPLPLVLA